MKYIIMPIINIAVVISAYGFVLPLIMMSFIFEIIWNFKITDDIKEMYSSIKYEKGDARLIFNSKFILISLKEKEKL